MKISLPKGWIYISEFEKLTGISSKTIAAAIKQGKIPKKYLDRVGKHAIARHCLKPKEAAQSWYSNLNPSHPITRAVFDKLENYLNQFSPVENGKSKEIKDLKEQSGEMTYAQASLKEKVAKAKLAELDLKEREGILVSKALVDEQLFNAGKEIREAILAVPNRIIDEVIAASDNRTLAQNVLYDALSGVLEEIAELIQQ